jgi:hypothetical protein
MFPLIVHLHKTHFTINDFETPIKLDTLEFQDSINQLQIPSGIPFSEENYECGRLVLDIFDHRYNSSEPTRLKLEATTESIHRDIQRMIEQTAERKVSETEIEQKLLLKLHPKLSLGNTFHANNSKQYNAKKYLVNKTTVKKEQKKPSERKELIKLMLLLDKGKLEFYPRFNQLSFVEEWRAKKEQANREQMIGLGDKNKIKINPMGNQTRKLLTFNLNRRIIKTLRFESNCKNDNVSTILNVYELPEGMHEGVLRSGVGEGMAVNGICC